MQEASYYRREGERVHCLLCPQDCHLADGKKGLCGVRLAEDGKLFTTNYGKYAAAAMDPIEKKPLYHFYPGHSIFSLGTVGCNLSCSFCQNWTLARSQERVLQKFTPEKICSFLEKRPSREQLGVAYTYNEPFIWFEFVLACSRVLSEQGFHNVLVTNGFVRPDPLEELLPYIDAMNIDVKAFNEGFYQRWCRGNLEAVLQTVQRAVKDCHVELTYLLIPTLNDDLAEVEKFINWVASLNPEIPVHFSRYYPQYKMDLPPTPLTTMEKVWELAKKHLKYVYLGNIPDGEANNTYCPSCGSLLLERRGYTVINKGLKGTQCSHCSTALPIVGKIYSH